MVKAIIFDFFGVICPDLYWSFLKRHVKDLEDKRNFFQDLSNQHDSGALPKKEFIRAISENSGVDGEKVLSEMNGAAVVDLELIGFIKILKGKYKIGILSNSGIYFIDKIFEENNLKDLFDSVVVSERVGVIKPQPEIFNIILDDLEISANEAIFIDDRESNTTAAEKLGIKSFVYTTLEKLKGDLREESVI